MADLATLVNRYIEGFNETDADRRHDLIEQLFTEDARYTDPQVEVTGREQIDAYIGQTQAAFPGYVFTLGGDIDGHHGQARFSWHATAPGESEAAYVGFDVLVADDDDGRVRSVYGFLDRVPAA
jgi:hypothetical protein